jgi:hypothetical protein
MSEGANVGPVLAEPQSEARDIIATCRSAWSTVHASQSGETEVDDSALTIYVASCEKLEELGYSALRSVEERSAELEIMLMDDETPYGGEVLVKAAASHSAKTSGSPPETRVKWVAGPRPSPLKGVLAPPCSPTSGPL